jgi:hypothetical protein
MANFLRITALMGVLAVHGKADSSVVRAVAETRDTRPFPAVDVVGPTHVTAREVKVELNRQDGTKSTGRLGIVFDPSTGFFLHQLSLYHEPAPWTDYLSSTARIGLSPDCLILAMLGDGVGILESTEKAANIDDAETKALKWIEDHLDKPDSRSYRTESIGVARWDFPKGFFRSEISSRAGLPVKIVDMQAHVQGWELILESTDIDAKIDANALPQKAALFIFRQGNMWVRNPVRPYESQKTP